MPVGPWCEDVRYKQVEASLREAYCTEKAGANVFWQEYLHEMLEEHAGQAFRDAENPEVALWSSLPSSPVLQRGTKVSLGRYVELLRKLKRELSHWAQRKFALVHTVTELDMWGGVKQVQQTVLTSEVPATTSSVKESKNEKAMRHNFPNQMVAAAAEMLNPDTKRKDQMLVGNADAWLSWHSKQNTALRSTAESAKWLKQQLDGEFFKGVLSSFQTLVCEPALQSVGFFIPAPGQEQARCVEEVLHKEEEFADYHVRLVIVQPSSD